MKDLDVERWRTLARHLDDALELAPAQRQAWLEALSRRNTALACELQAVLSAEGELEPALAEIKALRDSLWSASADVRPRYELGDELARGGMGRVLVAKDTLLERTIAIKELLVDDVTAEARFLREAKLTARLEHPSIVPVHDAGRAPVSGKAFYAMKLVTGKRLSECIAKLRWLPERLALLPNLLAVVDAVAYAHNQHIIHRDLTPNNVLIGPYGETLVVDWGLAKHLDDDELETTGAARSEAGVSMTGAGAVLGTPAYMPPEQARGEVVDRRADVYALGAILYTLISGKAPYTGATQQQVLEQALASAPPRLSQLEPGTAPDLCAIVERAMARDLNARYCDARELAADLRRYLNGQLVSAYAYSWRQMFERTMHRHRALTSVSVMFALTLLIGAAAAFAREQHLRHLAEAASCNCEKK